MQNPDPKCELYYPRGVLKVCIKCASSHYLDTKDNKCRPADTPIPSCVDMVKIGDTVYCNACENGFPSEAYAFTACSKFSTEEVVDS